MNVNMSVCLSICLTVSMYICLSVCLSACLPVNMFACQTEISCSICISQLCLFVCLSVCIAISVCFSAHVLIFTIQLCTHNVGLSVDVYSYKDLRQTEQSKRFLSACQYVCLPVNQSACRDD